MKLHYPDFKYSYDKNGDLFFVGIVQPSLTMPAYKISIAYKGSSMPEVKVIEPALVEEPPHYYFVKDCLCLYKPGNFNWTASKPISNYIVPWATCWLYFYEAWKETGEWLGPEAGHNHNNRK